MEPGGKVQSPSQAKGMRQLLGQGERLLASLEGLVRIAKHPQGKGRIGQGRYFVVCPCPGRAWPPRIVKSNRPLTMFSGRGPLSTQVQDLPQHNVAHHEEGWV